MIDKIRQYFIDNFDRLNPASAIGVDYLGSEPISYNIESGISDPWIREYVDGGGVKQYNFLFTSREWFGSNSDINTENLEFYHYIEDLINENNRNGIVPNVAGAVKVEVLTSGYLMSSEADNAKYQIQLRLVYTV